MELAPRYCRSCGSRILVKNVCHNCNNDPIKGDNYCYDCGSLTPNADSCLRCGAKYKAKLPLTSILLTSGLLIAIIAVGGYFLSRPQSLSTKESQEEKIVVNTPQPKSNELLTNDTITNTIANPLNPVNTTDTAAIITSPNPIPVPTAVDTVKIKPDSIKRNVTGSFSSQELSSYRTRCRYFIKNQRSQVLFFTSGSTGYIKVNNNVSQLATKRKGNDVTVFGNNEYQATLTIDGLTGSEKEWVASCTLVIKDLVQNTTYRHKVYSTCID